MCPDAVIPVYGTPRTVAGDVDTADTMKCQLRPLNRNDDYGPLGLLTFTDDAVGAARGGLPRAASATTACRASSKQSTITWMTYQDEAGDVIYGGTPLPPAPVGVAPGWVSEAFYTCPSPAAA